MNSRRLIISLSFAVFFSAMFTFWLSRHTGSHSNKPPSVQYIGTSRDMNAGDVIKQADLQQISWAASTPLEGVFSKPEELEGRTLLFPSAKGQPLVQRQVSAPGAGVGLSVKIPDGMRAISLKSDQVVGVAGFLLPGTHVDVLVTYHTLKSSEPVTSTVLQDVEILTAGQKMQPDPEGRASTVDVVTLLATPSDAEKVVLASAQGTVHFVLRNGSDHVHANEQPMQMSSLGEVADRPQPVHVAARKVMVAPAAAPLKKYTVETIRGDKQSVETF